MSDQRVARTVELVTRLLVGYPESSPYAAQVIRDVGGIETARARWVNQGVIDRKAIRKQAVETIDRTDRILYPRSSS